MNHHQARVSSVHTIVSLDKRRAIEVLTSHKALIANQIRRGIVTQWTISSSSDMSFLVVLVNEHHTAFKEKARYMDLWIYGLISSQQRANTLVEIMINICMQMDILLRYGVHIKATGCSQDK